LTDNERTVTIDHVAGVPVRNPEMVAIGGHYGITIATWVPADPDSRADGRVRCRSTRRHRHQDPPALDVVSDRGVDVGGIATEEVGFAHRADIGLTDTGDQGVDRRQDEHLQLQLVGRLGHPADEGAVGARHGDQDCVGVVAAGRSSEVAHPALHPDARQTQVALGRIVVEQRHRRVPRVGRSTQRAKDLLGALAGAHHDEPLQMVTVRTAQPLVRSRHIDRAEICPSRHSPIANNGTDARSASSGPPTATVAAR
jgi:hypothetical protein